MAAGAMLHIPGQPDIICSAGRCGVATFIFVFVLFFFFVARRQRRRRPRKAATEFNAILKSVALSTLASALALQGGVLEKRRLKAQMLTKTLRDMTIQKLKFLKRVFATHGFLKKMH